MPTAINSNYSPYTGKTKTEDKKEDEKGIIEKSTEATATETARGTRIVKRDKTLIKMLF